ncbi:LysE family translocator [Microbacterium kyungheense]|uniref:Threonine/homoserine/homoserine lactone efflux protein n=1 Tax=Microbacterium kyungheense TaxID=1263636 RepID=A0A543EQ72_9MICO|nr:LysE family translocator [Microbacterium kyungheense]TQM23736.1 threonine/homoserine/homoserine lactone efflux protein [Microbacterium kyungheense]
MVPVDNLIAFTLAALVLIVIPGPSVLFTIGRALALGRIGGLLSVLGNALGLLPVIGLVALGVGGIVAQSIVLFTILKVAGALYLMYLGVQAIRHRHRTAAAATAAALPRSAWRQLGEGFVVGVTNPKTIAFFVAVLPQFVDLNAGSVPLQMIELGLVFFTIALLSDGAWALVAAAARSWFGRSPKRIATLSATGGGLMIGLGGILLLTGNKH